MSVTANTPTGQAIKGLKRMASLSPVFQAGVGVSGDNAAASAMQFIHVPSKRAKANQKDKPFIVIKPTMSNSVDTELVGGGGKHYFRLAGSLDLQVVREVGNHATDEDELIDFINFSEGIWLDLLNLAAADDHLTIDRAPCVYGPAKSGDAKVSGNRVQRPFYKAVFEITWK